MMKLCFLQYLYNLSDEKVMEEAALNLAFLYFPGLNPEDTLPHPSLLAKFRTQRLKDVTLDEVIQEIIRQCIQKGLLNGKGLSVDTTHIEANCSSVSWEITQSAVRKHAATNLNEEKYMTN